MNSLVDRARGEGASLSPCLDEKAGANSLSAESLRLHALAKGKVQMMPKCGIHDLRDFAIWYTPGVAQPCRAICANTELAYEYTNRSNSIAIVSDGTRVLGLGDIGPEAGMPVMEGKALLFKYLGGIDAIPLCLGTKDPGEIIRTVKLLEPSFGGVNLEDMAQPKCFRILEALRAELKIPVWHDDQQGTATVVLAGLYNALEIVGRELGSIKVAMIGIGAANVATYNLLKAAGVNPLRIVACDSKGALHTERHDIEERKEEFREKWQVCLETNGDGTKGGIADALRGADVCLAFSRPGPDTIKPAWVKGMNRGAVVFACANPTPEIWPRNALDAGARIVGTALSRYPNQINNSLVFPAVFRGTLDVRARTISGEMQIAAARELARYAASTGCTRDTSFPGWTNGRPTRASLSQPP